MINENKKSTVNWILGDSVYVSCVAWLFYSPSGTTQNKAFDLYVSNLMILQQM